MSGERSVKVLYSEEEIHVALKRLADEIDVPAPVGTRVTLCAKRFHGPAGSLRR